jgi:hypothetical protein
MSTESPNESADAAAQPQPEKRVRPPNLRRLAPWGALLLLFGLHLALTLHFAPPSVMFSDQPTYTIDFALHYYQVDSAKQNFAQSGRLWGYDPTMLAGHPIGAIEDLSSKSIELWVIALTSMGLSQGKAFNLYVLLVHLLLPFCALLTAWLFRLGAWQRVWVVAAWFFLWFFDSLFHWLWFCGMVSWATASYLIPLQLGLLYRAFDAKQGAYRFWIPSLLLASLLALVHPFAALALAAPVLGLYLRDLKRSSRATHLFFWLMVAAAASVAMIWLIPALSMSQYILQTDDFLRPGPLYLISDFFDVTFDIAQTGMPVRTMLRMLMLVAGGLALYKLSRQKDRRYLPLALAAGATLLLAYTGGLIWITRQTQPYRQIAPAMLLASIAAIPFLGELLSPKAIREAGPKLKLVLILAALIVTPRLVRTVITYFPEALFKNSVGARSTLGDVASPPTRPMRHTSPPKDVLAVRAWIEAHKHRSGRVLIEDYMMAEFIAATSDVPILGGLAQRAIPQADSHLFRIQGDGALPRDKLRAYLERFAIRYVVVTNIIRKLEWNRELLVFRKLLGRHRIYETKIEPSYFLEGSGHIRQQAMNTIQVQATTANQPEIVLRFHWLETLRCREMGSKRPCALERYPIRGARTGFIRIPNPPADFEIYNSYQLGPKKWRGSRARVPKL